MDHSGSHCEHDDHGHEHHHHHGHMHARPGTWQLWVLTGLSAAYMVAEVVGGLISGSLALLADAGHMAVDVGAILLSLFAIWIARRPPSPDKTYGYYRAEILAALVNGAALFVVSIGIFYEAFDRFYHPHVIQGGIMALVSTGGLAVNLIGMAMVHQTSRHNLNLRSVWLHLFTDALGSVASLVAAGLVIKFGWTMADPIISILIGVFILYGGYNLLSDCVNVLLEGVPKGIDIVAVRRAMEAYHGVAEVHDLHIWTVTSGVVALSAHVRLVEDADHGAVLETVIELLKNDFHIEHVTLQLEPAHFTHGDNVHLHA
jgi:cobalt-zinc-cadmium efflux system protein